MAIELDSRSNLEEASEPAEFAEFGLHCLRKSTSDMCVVFVHGILSSGETAWGHPSWPELLEAEPDFEDVGIYIFTYRTSLFSRTYSVADAADALREHLSIEQLWDAKKLVFVCHSMGGIVVRRLLVANQVKLFSLDPIIGLFLVASPSLGAKDANLLSVLSFALEHTQAAALRFSQANTSLDELHRDFKTLLHSGQLSIVGRELLEDRPIKVKRWLGLWGQTVEPFSASAYFHQPECEPLRIPGSDHVTIVKPETAGALQHRALKRFLTLLSTLASVPAIDRIDNSRIRSGEETPLAITAHSARVEEQGGPHPVQRFPARLNNVACAGISPERLDTEPHASGASERNAPRTASKLAHRKAPDRSRLRGSLLATTALALFVLSAVSLGYLAISLLSAPRFNSIGPIPQLSSTAIINHVRCETRLAIQDKLISRLARIDQSGAQGRLSQARTSVWGSDVTGFLSGASLELFNRVAEAAIAYDFSLYTAEGATSLVASGGSNGRHILFPQTFRKILEDPELVCGEDNIVGKIGIDEVISSFLDVDSFTRGKLPAYAYTIEFATIVTGPLPLRALISTAGASQGIVPPPSADSRTDRHVLIVALSSDPQGDPADQGGTMPSVAKPPSTAQESDIPAGEREALDRINQSRLDAYLDRAWR